VEGSSDFYKYTFLRERPQGLLLFESLALLSRQFLAMPHKPKRFFFAILCEFLEQEE
jgi:hypothetical protein